MCNGLGAWWLACHSFKPLHTSHLRDTVDRTGLDNREPIKKQDLHFLSLHCGTGNALKAIKFYAAITLPV
jgi:hypothetical protein